MRVRDLEALQMIYLDSSAYLCVLLGEKQSEKIEKLLQGKALCSSSFLVLEVERNLVRLSREKVISEKDFSKLHARLKSDVELFLFKDLDFDLSLSGVFPAVKTPRSSDLVHLRTALWFMNQERLGGFLTLDQHQLEAAMEMKLPVIEIVRKM